MTAPASPFPRPAARCAAAGAAPAPRPVTGAPPRSFPVYAELCARYSGLKFSEQKSYLLEARLSAIMRREGCADLDALAAALAKDPSRLEPDIAEALLNNETFFFRDRAPFDELQASVLPRLKAARSAERRLRIWSAACSTGQEPYSLSMIFAEDQASWRGWGIEILGTDLSRSALTRARSGLYTQFEVQRGLSTHRLLQHFTKEGERWRLKNDIRSRVRFLPRNLMHPLPGGECFDIIFARNVLMYFGRERKAEVLARLRASLAPDGVIILGAAETLFGFQDLFRPAAGNRGYYSPAPPLTTTGICPDSPGTAHPVRGEHRESPTAYPTPNQRV